jgi:hypothetical protein
VPGALPSSGCAGRGMGVVAIERRMWAARMWPTPRGCVPELTFHMVRRRALAGCPRSDIHRWRIGRQTCWSTAGRLCAPAAVWSQTQSPSLARPPCSRSRAARRQAAAAGDQPLRHDRRPARLAAGQDPADRT